MIIHSEDELHKWFKKNAHLFGYDRVIKEYVPFGEPFPDFYCLKGRYAEFIELELFSYNFVIHKHDVSKVDKVMFIEDNSLYYGMNFDDEKFFTIPYEYNLQIDNKYYSSIRCKRRIKEMIQKNSQRMLTGALRWYQHEASDKCCICNGGLHLDRLGRIIFGQHTDCLSLLKEKLIQSLA